MDLKYFGIFYNIEVLLNSFQFSSKILQIFINDYINKVTSPSQYFKKGSEAGWKDSKIQMSRRYLIVRHSKEDRLTEVALFSNKTCYQFLFLFYTIFTS